MASPIARISSKRLPELPGGIRRVALALMIGAGLTLGLAACSDDTPFHATNLAGSSLPDLGFTMTRADDGKTVTAADYKGKVTLLYFGYTYCPDICPLTLANTMQALKKLGKDADDVRLLFVTVDPDRDTPDILKDYADAFGPEVDGLRGTANQLASLAKRYRVAYSVKKADTPDDYVVTHSSAMYAFDRQGDIRLLFTSMHTSDPKIDAMADDLNRLIDNEAPSGVMAWLGNLV